MLAGSDGGFEIGSISRRTLLAAALAAVTVQVSSVTGCSAERPTFLRQGWGERSASHRLPTWFGATRIQAHTRLDKSWVGSPEFENAAAGLKQLGAEVFVRHVKSGENEPMWPSAVPLGANGEPLFSEIPNRVEEMVAEAHGRGSRMIAYYWHMSDAAIARQHPEWVCKTTDGAVISGSRGAYLDLTTPYREVVLKRLLELAEMGVDGFYFDEVHMPLEGSWGTNLEKAFREATGLGAPQSIDRRDPNYRLYLDFQASKVEETFAYWRDEIKRRYPEIVFIVSTTTISNPADYRMTTNLIRIADSPKNEYHGARSLPPPQDDVRRSFEWTLLRDSAEGRPPHIWAPGFPDVNHARAFAAAVMTHGAIANMDVTEEIILSAGAGSSGLSRSALKEVFALGEKVSPYLSESRPLRWAAVHFSELARNRRKDRDAWRAVLWPAFGAFKFFLRAGVPVGIVNDYQLEKGQLEGYDLLFLTNGYELTSGQRTMVEQFESGGGAIRNNSWRWSWKAPDETEDATRALEDTVDRLISDKKSPPPPLKVSGGPEKMHAVAFENRWTGQMVVALTNDFSWVQVPKDGEELLDVNSPAPPASGVKVSFRSFRPKWAFEALSGRSLKIESTVAGDEVSLPQFLTMALLVVE